MEACLIAVQRTPEIDCPVTKLLIIKIKVIIVDIVSGSQGVHHNTKTLDMVQCSDCLLQCGV